MSVPRVVRMLFVPMLAMLGFSPYLVLAQEATPVMTMPSGTEVVAAGLTNPRGMTWGADGTLFVALAGSGGNNPATEWAPTTAGIGPFSGGPSGAVVSIDASGCPVMVAGNLPSTLSAIGDVLGAEDVAILGDQIYASVDGGGTVHGNPDAPSGVYRLIQGGTSELIADLSAWSRANPVANIPPDADPDAGGYSIVANNSANVLWVSDPNYGQILSVTPDGTITRIADLSEGHMVPTKMVVDPNGGVYVGTLTTVPFPDGQAKVMHVAADGTVTDVWTNLTTVVDVGVGADGTLYALQLSTNNLDQPPFLNMNAGQLVRQTGPDTSEVVLDGLMLPIGLDMGPDGAWYIALPAIGANGGEGMILRYVPGGAATPAAGGAPSMPTCTPLPETVSGAVPGQQPAPPAPASPEATAAAAPTEAAAAPTEAPAAQTANVTIANFAFDPGTLNITAGTTVVFTNNDSATHTATADDGSWDTGNLAQGASASITFDTPGTYTYHCAIHPSMTATIVGS